MTTKLPVLGSQVTTTAFCAARLDGPDGHLWIDGNAKITAGNGTYAEPMPNAFSLEAQAVADREADAATLEGTKEYGPQHCPGSTAICRSSCYVHGLEKHAGDTYALYRHNSTKIREIISDTGRGLAWAFAMAEWIKTNAAGGFRWHVSGDIFSAHYARWIAVVVAHSPSVNHWIYTRSFKWAEALRDLPNLSLNLSCDRDNYAAAREALERPFLAWGATRVRLAYLTDDGAVPEDLPAESVVFPDYPLRAREGQEPTWFRGQPSSIKKMTCPVDLWGKSDVRRCGPCSRCL